jgi:hypothetical protein
MLRKFGAHVRQQFVGYLALFIALGGSAYAVAANSVGTAQLKNRAVTNPKLANNAVGTRKVIDGSLLKQDFKAGQVPATDIVVRRRDVVPVAPPNRSFEAVGCDAGEKLVGGGVIPITNNGALASGSGDAVRFSAPADAGGNPSGEGETPEEWLSGFSYTQAFSAGDRIRHYALCARP